MVEEKEFFIRKAIGWVIREVSKKRAEAAEEFLMEIARIASGLSLREGMKHLPDEVQSRIKSAQKAAPRSP